MPTLLPFLPLRVRFFFFLIFFWVSNIIAVTNLCTINFFLSITFIIFYIKNKITHMLFFAILLDISSSEKTLFFFNKFNSFNMGLAKC
jgi:hypothetical protein